VSHPSSSFVDPSTHTSVGPTNHSVFAAVAGAVFVSSVDIIKCPTNVSILSLRLSLDQLDHFGLLRESALVCTVRV
jgi:hypothetical protein